MNEMPEKRVLDTGDVVVVDTIRLGQSATLVAGVEINQPNTPGSVHPSSKGGPRSAGPWRSCVAGWAGRGWGREARALAQSGMLSARTRLSVSCAPANQLQDNGVSSQPKHSPLRY